MATKLLLTRAAVLMTVAREAVEFPGRLSVAITAKALVTYDLLLARYAEIIPVEASATGQRLHEMAVRPTRLDILTGYPALTISATAVAAPIEITSVLHLTLNDPSVNCVFTTHHAVGDLTLSAQKPSFTMPLPALLFTRGPHH